jgi:hypothetical protein
MVSYWSSAENFLMIGGTEESLAPPPAGKGNGESFYYRYYFTEAISTYVENFFYIKVI